MKLNNQQVSNKIIESTDNSESKYLKNDDEILHLKDLIKDITGIVLYNDINDAHILSTIQLEEDIDDIEDSFEATCLNMSDKQLTTISDEDLHRITNVELLDRLVKICKDRLSVNQIKLLQDFYKQKIIIDKEDIQVLLNCVKLCNNLFIEGRHKNIDFMQKYCLNSEDILDIIKNLTIADYYTNTRSINFNHLGNNLIIFEPKITINENIVNLCIYVKLDIQETTGDTIMLISIHEADKLNKLPYTEEDNENYTPNKYNLNMSSDKNNIEEDIIKSSPNNAFSNKDLKDNLQQDNENSEKISNFIEVLYDLRKKSISEEGEYGLGNLVFKEFRNLGYLDNLKDLKNKARSRELSLEELQEAKKKKKKKLYNSIWIGNGNPEYDIAQFNKRFENSGYLNGTIEPDGSNVHTPEVSNILDVNSEGGSLGENIRKETNMSNLNEAKRYVRRYYIRPLNKFASNKAEIIQILIEADKKGQDCSIYTLNNLGDNKDITKLTKDDIIYYYDDGILYDKNKVKVMDYDLYIKHEEKRAEINPEKVSDSTFIDHYEDRITDKTKQEAFNLDFDSVNLEGEILHEDNQEDICCICGEKIEGYGNNAAPVKSGRCCDACNIKFVIPARMEQMKGNK